MVTLEAGSNANLYPWSNLVSHWRTDSLENGIKSRLTGEWTRWRMDSLENGLDGEWTHWRMNSPGVDMLKGAPLKAVDLAIAALPSAGMEESSGILAW
jgi:hypothetical protein